MSNLNNGGPAFPMPAEQCVYDQNQGMIGTEGYGRSPEYGMSLRDYFAAKCAQALPAPSFYMDAKRTKESLDCWARQSFRMADAMLAARSA